MSFSYYHNNYETDEKNKFLYEVQTLKLAQAASRLVSPMATTDFRQIKNKSDAFFSDMLRY